MARDPDSYLTNVDTPEGYPRISVTELRDLLRCTKKHDYGYRQGLKPAVTPGYFGKGRYLHAIMEAFYTDLQQSLLRKEALRKDGGALGARALTAMAQARVGGDASSVVGEPDRAEIDVIVADYLRNVDTSDLAAVPMVEQAFYADIGLVDHNGVPVLLYGFIDALVETTDGSTWLIEHKTAGRAWSQGQFTFDYQTRLYSAAVAALTGSRPTGTMFNFFYPKRWESKVIYTTEEESNHLITEVQRAIYLRDSGSIVRQPHWGCGDCSFKNICHAELIGADSDHLRATEYIVDQDKVDRFTEED